MLHWSTIYLVSEWTIRLAMLVYVPQRRSAAASRTWLLLIFLLPLPGLVLYGVFGRIRVPTQRIEQQRRISQRLIEAQEQTLRHVTQTPDLPSYLDHLPEFARKLGDFQVFAGNQIELLADYDQSFSRLIDDIGSATHHVHILTYIFGNDATGQRLTDALLQAAGRGVQCRLLADAVGSRSGLRRHAEKLRNAGIEVVPLLQVGFFRKNASRFDLRNHRKLAVIDGRIGYAGSQNCVDPYFVPGHPNEELVVRVTGPVVAQLQAIILSDHFIEAGGNIDYAHLFPDNPGSGTVLAQMLPGTPRYQRENTEELFLAMLYAARQRVVITTPYFVPNDSFLDALRVAARRGIEIRLIVSKHANQALTQYAQRSYYDDLLAAGIHVHLYRPRFLHAKHLSIDDSIAVFGSANIDIRSFALNAESSLIVYDTAIVAQLREIQERYLADSELLTAEVWRQRKPSQRVLQNLARLMDSLL